MIRGSHGSDPYESRGTRCASVSVCVLGAAGHLGGEDKPLGLLLLERPVHQNRAALAWWPSGGEHADALLSVTQIEGVGVAPNERGVLAEIRDVPTDRDAVPIEAIRVHQDLAW